MKKNKIWIQKDPKSHAKEAYRILRTNIQFSAIDRILKSLVVTSSLAGEGKTTTSVNLAYSIAQTDKKVMLIDCDLRRPMIHKVFEVSNLVGLTTIISENLDYKEFVQRIDDLQIDILTSGPIPPNPTELLGSKRMKNILDKMKEEYDMIIIDSPPVGIVTDAALLSTLADGTLLVCLTGKTELEAIKLSKAALDKVNANIVGVIMNKVSVKKGKYYAY